MNVKDFIDIAAKGEVAEQTLRLLGNRLTTRIHLKGMVGSGRALLLASLFDRSKRNHLVVCTDKETAAYFFNDLEALFEERDLPLDRKMALFYPASYNKNYDIENQDSTNILLRTEALRRLCYTGQSAVVITYPQALVEKVVGKPFLDQSSIKISFGQHTSVEKLADLLNESNFDRADFVYEPGQFAIRGGIVDVFSFGNDYPYRIEFAGNRVESVRSFNPADQLTMAMAQNAVIIPNTADRSSGIQRLPFFDQILPETVVWSDNIRAALDMAEDEVTKSADIFMAGNEENGLAGPTGLFIGAGEFAGGLSRFTVVETGPGSFFDAANVILCAMEPQPSFNKNFGVLSGNLAGNTARGIMNVIVSDNMNQLKRLHSIFRDIETKPGQPEKPVYDTAEISLHEGFIDRKLKLACYTDHQIFERYHKFRLKEKFEGSRAMTLKDLHGLKPGDYITHIDHGIGRFDGLEKIMNDGKEQEAIRIIYKDGDLLYISIHSLHRIAKFTGSEGAVPTLNRLGSNAWNRLKEKTKKKVKDIAKDLIKLYAERKSSDGFAFSPDTYLQHELEASFIYEDTPDQFKATQAVKSDMEAGFPMDRLVCGDVGFGKTEVAIRAAFKAVADSKQAAVLVPTTILALQHYQTFSERLAGFPCKVEYISRFRSARDQKEILRQVETGKVDILIGTHKLLGKGLKFKDLGLMVIDEEQKFGVAAKEKLKQIKVNVDTLTLTATPIPRTLQFSLMGARDLSVINTPPPNRYPVQTEAAPFNEDLIREAIHFEVARGGQVFFVHNRVQNISEVAALIARVCPDVRIAIGHGQLEGRQLEKVMLDFVSGFTDVLISTTIIESGLDIPNVNTILINNAHHFGLSDLHQLRGRVGRSNKKAFCYLLAAPQSVLTSEARKRLRALEEFSNLGSGFNIAMRDLDIRGAGNILGAEQSGFISEIGFEMYHKILDEALLELREKEFKHLYREEPEKQYVRECQIETDLSILIPDDYVTNIAERLSLYRELDNIQEEVELQRFRLSLIDRFGPLPLQTEELIEAIRLRWLAREIGFGKITMKNGRLTGYFVPDSDSSYFQSEKFGQVIEYLKNNPRDTAMRDANGKPTLLLRNVHSVQEAMARLKKV